jgi:hypothetical protein
VTRSLAIAVVGLLATSPALAGEPVLLPDFTPGTVSEFSLASLLQQNTMDALARAGHVVLTSEVVEPVVGGSLDACADDPACPLQALAKLPARFGVVVRVRREGAKVMADVALFEQTGGEPIESRTFEIEGGNEALFGREVADMIDNMVKVMGPADAQALIAAARMITAWEATEAGEPGTPAGVPAGSAGEPVPDPAVTPDPAVGVPVAAGPDVPLTPEARVERALADTPFAARHLVGVRDRFTASELDIRDWVYKTTPHAGRVIVEVRGGLGIGDVDRLANVRTTVAGGEQTRWFQEQPTSGQRVRGELFVGYAPSAWFDIGVLLGLQYGSRTLNSGWSDDAGNGASSEDTVQAAQLDLEPRVRLYPVRTGPVKPYLFGGVDLRFFDAWRISQVENIVYAEPPGGMVPGPVGGLGLLVDPSPIVGVFVEGAFTLHTGIRSKAAQNDSESRPADAPDALDSAGYTVAVSGGVQFRL